MKKNTHEVELYGSKIGGMGEQQSKTGTGDLFFLHGLLGKGINWRSFALNDAVSKNRNMHLIDLRNHGESNHHHSMTYEEMANDVLRYADAKDIEKLSIIGHNMGAKIGMTLSCMYPDRVAAMISLDTPPLSN